MGCCNSLEAILRDCETSLGGIKKVWANCYDTAGEPTVTAGKISALGSTAGWVEIQFRKETSNFEVTMNRDNTAGTLYYSIILNIVLQKMTTEKWSAIHNFNLSDLAFIVLDNNGKYWYLGFDDYYELNDGSTATTGTAFGDLNGYTLGYTGYERQPPYEVTEDAMTNIINPTP